MCNFFNFIQSIYLKIAMVLILCSSISYSQPSLQNNYLIWQQCYRLEDSITFAAIENFVKNNPDWPNYKIILNAESLMDSGVDDYKILTWFKNRLPLTAKGLLRYLNAEKNKEQALIKLKNCWYNISFSDQEWQLLLTIIGKHITSNDYIERAEELLLNEKTSQVRQMLDQLPLDIRELTDLRLMMLENNPNNQQRITAEIEKNLIFFSNHAGFYYQRVKWLLANRKNEEALKLLLSSPFIDFEKKYPEKWWRLRNLLCRRLIEEKKFVDARNVIKNHQLTKGAIFFDAQYLNGWILLNFLKNPRAALPYFTKTYAEVQTPISLSAMAFWAGEAEKSMGQQEKSVHWYKLAATHKNTYYGQLAISRLKILGIPVNNKIFTSIKLPHHKFLALQNNPLVQIVMNYATADTAGIFVNHLSEKISDPEEHAMLVELIGRHPLQHLAVEAAKKGIKHKQLVTTAAYPMVNKKTVESLLNKIQKPYLWLICHAIARQESNFQADVISRAGAKGLMQLMDATAKKERQRLQEIYNIKLKNYSLFNRKDNLILGLSHINYLWNLYHGCLVLMFAAYNAGENAVAEWIEIFGDPRDRKVNMVEWIECIPYGETRDYVKKVLAGLMVYLEESKLSFSPDLIAIMHVPNAAY